MSRSNTTLSITSLMEASSFKSKGCCSRYTSQLPFIPQVSKLHLLQVHRTMLSKDSSTFETMFKLPPCKGGVAEGRSDDHPVILQGDTPEQFRSLLWALYAMYVPSTLQFTFAFHTSCFLGPTRPLKPGLHQEIGPNSTGSVTSLISHTSTATKASRPGPSVLFYAGLRCHSTPALKFMEQCIGPSGCLAASAYSTGYDVF